MCYHPARMAFRARVLERDSHRLSWSLINPIDSVYFNSWYASTWICSKVLIRW